MKTKTLTIISRCKLVRTLSLLNVLLGLFLCFPGAWRAAATTSVALRYTGSDFEGLQAFELEWTAVSNATYGVQVSTDLASGLWDTVDLVTPTGNVGKMSIPPAIKGIEVANPSARFFRLVLPQPLITAVEPAIFPPGVPLEAFIVGQCFASNDVVRVDGVPLAGVTFLSPNLLQGPLPSLSVGPHLVELVSGGVVQSSFTVTCADAVTNPELVLQGPPDEPPASPVTAWLSKKGYDYYQAQSQLNSAALQNNPYFIPSDLVGQMPDSHLTSLGGGGVGAGLSGGPVPDQQQGKSTQVTRSNISNNRSAGGGGSVSPFSGEVQLSEADLIIPGRGLDFIWARTYHSRMGRTGSSTNGWTFSYDVKLQPLGGDFIVHNGTGRADRFKPGTNGIYTCPEFFGEGALSNDVFKLTFADTGYWEFKPLTASADAGKLSKIVGRNGNTMLLHYDGAGRLAQVVDDLDRTNTVTYNIAGQLESITDFSRRTVRYEYDTFGDLVACVSPPVVGTPNGNDFPRGKTNSYTYSSGFLDDRENHLLLTVRNADLTITHEYIYQHNQTNLEFLRCISTQRWTNAPTTFSYQPQLPTLANGFATLRCVVNDPVGNVTAISTDARGRCVKLEEFTGRAAPGTVVADPSSLPIPKLRPTDPASYVTTLAWNEDSLCTLMVLPDGGREETVHQRAFNQNSSRSNNAKAALHNGDVRIVRQRTALGVTVDFDGDGVAEATERVWRYEYDPRFGSPLFGQPLGNGVAIKVKGTGADKNRTAPGLPLGNGVAIKWKGTGADANRIFSGQPKIIDNSKGLLVDFCISVTDPRGNVTTGSYDANGNLLSRVVIPVVPANRPEASPPLAHFSYNPYGQLIAITNAADANGRRSVDTLVYGDDPFTVPIEPPGPFPFMVTTDDGPGGLRLTNRFSYDARGNLTSTIDPLGHDWLYTYNALDQCVRIQTPTNIVARCATDLYYDANDHLVQTATELRYTGDSHICTAARHFRRNPLGLVTSVETPVDCTTFMTNGFGYNANDWCVLELGPAAVSGADPHQVMAHQYDTRGMLYRTVAAPGSVAQSTTQCDYDSRGNTVRVSVGLEETPSVTTMEYDGFAGFPGALASPMPNVPTPRFGLAWVETVWNKQCVEKDISVRASRITDPMGNVATFHYDANDNLRITRHFGETNDVAGTNGNLHLAETRYTHDGLDRMVASHEAHFSIAGQAIGDGYRTTTFAFAPNGQCSSITDDLGRITAFYYDTAGRGTNVTSPGLKTSFAVLLDAGGRATNCVRLDRTDLGGPPQVFSWTNVFDSLGRCVSSTDNVGNNENWDFDSLSRCVKHTDAKGIASFLSYDMLGRETLVVRDLDGNGVAGAGDSSVSYYWTDLNPREPSVTMDSHGNPTSYGYDSLGRTTSITNADGTRLSLVWSPRSNLIEETDENGTVVTNHYDLRNRIVHRDIAARVGVATTTTFETFAYDGCSQLVAATNDVSVSTFSFDSHGNRISETCNGLITLATYDALGNRLSLSYPEGRVLTYGYDALDRCTNILENGLSLASFDYDGPDRVARIGYANDMRTRIFYAGISGVPNALGDFGHGQIRRIRHAVSGASPVVSEITLEWDRNQNKLGRQVAIFQPAIPRTNLMTFTYDAADRLTQAIVLNDASLVRDTSYSLDRMGNRTNVVGAISCSGNYLLDAVFPGPLDFQMNQYTATPCDSRSYDDCGNLISRNSAAGPVTYQYDYADRLVLVQALDLNSGTLAPVASYAYDALGRRISKIVFDGNGQPPLATEFYFDGDSVIEERSSGTVPLTYVRPLCSGVGAYLAMRRNGKDYFFHTDDQGNPVALTTTGGAVVERYEFDDYGAVMFLTSDGVPTTATSSAVGNRMLFQGMEWDVETGLYYGGSDQVSTVTYKATQGKTGKAKQSLRYADPNTGRGITRSDEDNNPWSQRSGINGINGGMPNRISMNVTVPKQTQGATFGEKVNAGLHAAGSALSQGRSGGLAGSGGGAGGSRAQDHNSSRSNKTASIAQPGGGGGGGSGGSKAQDHNSSRSNKTASMFDFGGGGGGGSGKLKHLLYTAKQGKTGSASGK